jgi:hypothetical protein
MSRSCPIRLRRARISAWGGLKRHPKHDETYIYWSTINLMAARVARSQFRARLLAPSPALLQAA